MKKSFSLVMINKHYAVARQCASRLGVVLATALILSHYCAAQSIAQESFLGAPGSDLGGQSGGAGWASPWAAASTNGVESQTIAPGSLAFAAGGSPLATDGNHLSITSAQDSFDQFNRSLTASRDNQTVYLSFLIRPTALPNTPGNPAYMGLLVSPGNTSRFFVGADASQPGFLVNNDGGGGEVSSSVAPTLNQTAFVVARMDLRPGNDTISLFINPTPGGTEPSTPDAVKNDLDLGSISTVGVTWGAGAAGSFDEIRFGNSFASVSPAAVVPEAGAFALMAATIPAMMFVVRRRLAASKNS